MNKKNLQKGFTLIELLVVVAIIAILALIVLLALNPVEMARRSRDSRRLSDVGTLRRAIDLSLADGESLVDTSGFVSINTGTSVTVFPIVGGMDISKYLSVVPGDPYTGTNMPQLLTGDSTNCAGATAGSLPSYRYWSNGDTYIIEASLESEDNCAAVTGDGNDNATYEAGTQPALTP